MITTDYWTLCTESAREMLDTIGFFYYILCYFISTLVFYSLLFNTSLCAQTLLFAATNKCISRIFNGPSFLSFFVCSTYLLWNDINHYKAANSIVICHCVQNKQEEWKTNRCLAINTIIFSCS